jgi:hypothetical protein
MIFFYRSHLAISSTLTMAEMKLKAASAAPNCCFLLINFLLRRCCLLPTLEKTTGGGVVVPVSKGNQTLSQKLSNLSNLCMEFRADPCRGILDIPETKLCFPEDVGQIPVESSPEFMR